MAVGSEATFRLCLGLVNTALKKMTDFLKVSIALGYNYKEWGSCCLIIAACVRFPLNSFTTLYWNKNPLEELLISSLIELSLHKRLPTLFPKLSPTLF